MGAPEWHADVKTLDVVSMPFVSTLDTAEAAPSSSHPAKANGDLLTFVQMIALGVVGFGIIILTARSIFAALNRPTAGLTIADAATRRRAKSAAAEAWRSGSSGPPHLASHTVAPGQRPAAVVVAANPRLLRRRWPTRKTH